MRVHAVIPARGGSKGIPGKNLKVIAGRSLLSRTIDAAIEARTISDVFVSSDAADILEEARKAGALTITRPPELATDEATSEAALLHALEQMEDDSQPDILVFLQCTSPFTTAQDIDGVVGKLASAKADCAFSVAPSHQFLWLPENGSDLVQPLGHEKHHRPRRQDRHPQYAETGAVYAMRVNDFRKAKHRFFGRVAAHITDERNLIEIDTPTDLEMARMLLSNSCEAISKKLPKKPAAVLFDFDGVMTDDAVYVDETGKETVRAHRGDGMGIEMLRKSGIPVGVISKEKNTVVMRRCEKLQIECIQGIDEKGAVIRRWSQDRKLDLAEVIYMGNDVNDLAAFDVVGYSAAPVDAHPQILASASIVLSKRGGNGAVRELCDLILATTDSD